MTKLQNAVWQCFISQVLGSKGAGTIKELVDEYGFTGPFAGLGPDTYKHYPNTDELMHDLENEIGNFGDLFRK